MREVNAEERMMGGERGEEEGKPLQLPDNLASYETQSYVKKKQRESEKWDVVTRG